MAKFRKLKTFELLYQHRHTPTKTAAITTDPPSVVVIGGAWE